MKTFRPRSLGFSLLEVLIAVVIMSVGLLALATLQLGIIRSSSEAKAQTVALNLARAKLEDLTSYRVVNEPTGTNCPSANDSYQCITSSAAAETLTDDGNGSLGGVNFTRTWTVDRCTGVAGGTFTCGQATTAAWSAAVPRNEFKNMVVTVSWTDAAGGPQSMAVRDAVGTIDPSDVALIQKKHTALTPRAAQGKIWDPGTVSGVIPIAVGNGTSSAATNPKPEVIAANSVVETRFDVLTYSGLNSGVADAQARVETAVVGCSCELATLATTERGLRPAYWNGVRYVVPSPTAAAPPARASTSANQSEKCDICCRDHHDPTGTTTAKFSPFVGTHSHFNSKVVGSTAVATAGQSYKEACRLIRVDGIFRVAPDLTNDYFALLATADMTSASQSADSPVPDPTATVSYQAFVIDYMNDRFTRKNNPASTATATDNATYNSYHSSSPCLSGSCALEVQNLASVARSPTLNEPEYINIADGDIKWGHSRGLFIDYLEPEAIQTIVNAKTNCLNQTPTNSLFSDCVLKYLPFTSINLTEIADWESEDTIHAKVTNNDYGDSADVDNVDPVRGKVEWGTAPTNNTPVDIRTKSRKSNSSLLDLSFDAISPDDDAKYTDSQEFRVQGTSANPGVNGEFEVNLSGTVGSTPAVRYVTGVKSSEACEAGNGPNYLENTCTVTNSTAGSGLTIADSMKVVVQKYNSQVDGGNNSATSTAGQFTCYDSGGTGPLPVPAGEKYTPRSCKNYEVSSATLVSAASVAGPSGTPASSVSDGLLSESTTIAFPLINVGDVITVNFTLTGTTSPTIVCSYVPKNPSGYNYTVTQSNCTP